MKASLVVIVAIMTTALTAHSQTDGCQSIHTDSSQSINIAQAINSSLGGIVDTILANNPSLRLTTTSGRTDVMQTRADMALEPTELEYSPFFTRGMSGMSSSELVISQSFRLPWAYASGRRLMGAQAAYNDAALQAMREEVRTSAATLCIEVIGLNHALQFIAQRLALTDSLIARYQQSDVTALDINQLRIERTAIVAEQLTACTARDKALLLLTEMNGGGALPTDLTSRTLDDCMACVGTPELNSTLNSVNMDSRMMAALAQVNVAISNEQVARHQALPSISIGYRRNTEGNVSSHGVLVGAAIPLFTRSHQRDIARLQRQTAEEQAHITALQLERERQTLQLELQLAITQLQATDVPLIQSTLQLLERSLQLRQITVADYINYTAPLQQQLQQHLATRITLLQLVVALQRQ